MKSEPDAFGIDDLQRVRIEPWTGVRNYTARNFMRDSMRVGDAVLFYHSNATPPGVAGLAKVCRTNVVDETQFDPASKYFDPKAKRDAPTWICVDVEFVQKFPAVLPLEVLRATPALEGMLLLRPGQRLSVMPVEPAHYQHILKLEATGASPAVSATSRMSTRGVSATRAANKTPARPSAANLKSPAKAVTPKRPTTR